MTDENKEKFFKILKEYGSKALTLILAFLGSLAGTFIGN